MMFHLPAGDHGDKGDRGVTERGPIGVPGAPGLPGREDLCHQVPVLTKQDLPFESVVYNYCFWKSHLSC